MVKRTLVGLVLMATMLLLTSCAGSAQPSPTLQDGQKVRVLATTTLVGDVVKQVGGEWVDLHVLLPVGADPHSFEPTPQDAAKLAQADLIFANGLDLEAFLEPLIESAGAAERVVYVSEGIEPLSLAAEVHDHAEESAGHSHGEFDPHVWMDPNNVMVWVDNIEKALSARDPAHAAGYAENARAYRQALKDLDAWIREQVAQVPVEKRKIVTDHLVFGYFAQRYGFEQVGAVVPGFSTLSAPSAQELAGLEAQIRALGVKTIFVGSTVNPAVAQRLAEDVGAKIVTVYTGSLSPADGPAATYLDFMRYNVLALVNNLK
ncbi:metal ABC transporter substrate-binding protein [Thermanaerothrix sp. 4228-RoL]|uniref:Metal ABC transporter substrate-binding protein n=1 Tax=Thermanaerothrix solaris TaxID=3058434 RepID=A0ABU3NMF0_9CHLR|nr:metal ABC transporter substrate-binding protein [Thermanaerothrix sp. 4228-RoL]MDT8898028.1 metal ABC transporter substrate-binding protein [Thermanaerothrix sp. 4228-RoL]